ncbi:dUTP diphosphatase [Alkalihalobacterium alkalinitrilicum]|uniref:dUTP diphosphatase n=1 Tax=Alkalihalobacterium alkalinitrilicum TaxID=427920 RepID=UPI00099534FC|nr:dUTP diphosphatase [Alkalihalobacterium alkalinitrilicum]
MNIEKLFDMQYELDKHIEKEHPTQPDEDRTEKRILALQVELGELANEHRGFKFWSHDQDPRTKVVKWEDAYTKDNQIVVKKYTNPLLEEYVDCLHFILSIGLDMKYYHYIFDLEPIKAENITKQFSFTITKAGTLLIINKLPNYITLLENFIGLGEMLEFTWEQIEQSYIEKNTENHTRQERGY